MSAESATHSNTTGPIFIVGAMGSGTTLVRLILDSHDSIAIAQETGFMRAVQANKWIPFWKFGGAWYGRLGWSEEELDAELSIFYDRLFQRFAQQQGKNRWGDKTPYHTWHMPQAARVFPTAAFVAIVRHPGAVSSSLHDRFNYSWPKAVNHWVRSNLELVRRAEDLGERLAILRYEDLVLDPEPVLRELLEWLGEPWSPRVLEHHVVHSERGTPANVEGDTRSDEPIDVSRISKWAGTIDDKGRRVLRDKADALAGFFGYDVDDAVSIEPLLPTTTQQRRHLLTGEDLVNRKAERGITDFGPWPVASLANQPLKPQKLEVALKSLSGKTSKNPPGTPDTQGSSKRPASSGSGTQRAAKAAIDRLPDPARRRVIALAKKAIQRR